LTEIIEKAIAAGAWKSWRSWVALVPGCLVQISEGEWREGWKRLPEDMIICTNQY
jgi:hypothetical protein